MLLANVSNASIYKCDISSPVSKTTEFWSFTFDTEKENNKFINLSIEQQTIAGCVALRATKSYVTCGVGGGSTQNSVYSTIEDGSPIFSISIRIAGSYTHMSCVKQ